MADQAPQPGRSITIRPEDTSLSVAQAIYHHVTARTEQIFESHSDNYEVDEEDILQLVHKIRQVAQRHHQEECSCVIEHALYKKERIRHSSFESFQISDRSQADATSEIVITYDFLSQNPFIPPESDVKPERYKITITISQEQTLMALDNGDGRPTFLPRIANIPTIGVSIRYVDYTIARSLLATTREWVSSLDGAKRSRFGSFFLRNQFNVSDMMPNLMISCILLGIAGVLEGRAISSIDAGVLFRFFALAMFFGPVGSLVAESFSNSVYLTQMPTTIRLTKGDANFIQNLKKKKGGAVRTVKFIALGVMFSILLNVTSNYIYDMIR